jgi:hypothetical protein
MARCKKSPRSSPHLRAQKRPASPAMRSPRRIRSLPGRLSEELRIGLENQEDKQTHSLTIEQDSSPNAKREADLLTLQDLLTLLETRYGIPQHVAKQHVALHFKLDI